MPLNPSNYKNIIFDLGGVIINIDYDLTTKAFEALNLNNFDDLFSQARQTQLFDRYEKGMISSAEFKAELNKYGDDSLDAETIERCWNAMLLDLPGERLDLLKKIKTTHRTFLLSNTNEIHIDSINNYLQKTFGIADLSGYFEKMYLSYKVRMRKPDAEIFELLLKENNLLPEETLFIDDSIQHIEAAKKLGIQTYWLDVKKESIVELFKWN